MLEIVPETRLLEQLKRSEMVLFANASDNSRRVLETAAVRNKGRFVAQGATQDQQLRTSFSRMQHLLASSDIEKSLSLVRPSSTQKVDFAQKDDAVMKRFHRENKLNKLKGYPKDMSDAFYGGV